MHLHESQPGLETRTDDGLLIQMPRKNPDACIPYVEDNGISKANVRAEV